MMLYGWSEQVRAQDGRRMPLWIVFWDWACWWRPAHECRVPVVTGLN